MCIGGGRGKCVICNSTQNQGKRVDEFHNNNKLMKMMKIQDQSIGKQQKTQGQTNPQFKLDLDKTRPPLSQQLNQLVAGDEHQHQLEQTIPMRESQFTRYAKANNNFQDEVLNTQANLKQIQETIERVARGEKQEDTHDISLPHTKSNQNTGASGQESKNQTAGLDQSGNRVVCWKHIDKEIEYFCKNCSALVCSKCMFHDHNGHNLAQLDDVSGMLLQNINDLLKLILNSRQLITNSKGGLESVLKELQKLQTDQITHIETGFKQMIKKLEDKMASLINECTVRYVLERKRFNDRLTEVREMEGDLDSIEQTYAELVKFIEGNIAAKVLLRINEVNNFIRKSIERLEIIMKTDNTDVFVNPTLKPIQLNVVRALDAIGKFTVWNANSIDAKVQLDLNRINQPIMTSAQLANSNSAGLLNRQGSFKKNPLPLFPKESPTNNSRASREGEIQGSGTRNNSRDRSAMIPVHMIRQLQDESQRNQTSQGRNELNSRFKSDGPPPIQLASRLPTIFRPNQQSDDGLGQSAIATKVMSPDEGGYEMDHSPLDFDNSRIITRPKKGKKAKKKKAHQGSDVSQTVAETIQDLKNSLQVE